MKTVYNPPAPPALTDGRRTAMTRTEYYGMFTPVEEALIRIAARETVTPAALQQAANDPAETQRLMAVATLQVMLSRTDALTSTDTIDLANPQVQQGLGLLVAMGLLTAERKTEIEAGLPA